MTAPSMAPEHDSPPAYRPLSGGAVTALVLALLLAIPAMIGVWWLEAIPVLIVLLSWSGFSSGRRRGKGLALVAGGIAVTVGGFAYASTRAIATEFERQFDRLMTALEQGDRKELTEWIVAGPEREATVDKCLAAYAGLRGRFGAYASRTKVLPSPWGPLHGALAAPDGVVDAVDAARAVPSSWRAIWFEAGFSKAKVFVAGIMFADDAEVKEQELDASMAGMKGGEQLRFRFRDLRFFVEKAD